MKGEWNVDKFKYIELSDGLGGGMTEEGYMFFEIDIDGWNDDEDFTDLETLVTIRATRLDDNKIEISIPYIYEEMKIDEKISGLINQAIEVVKDEFKSVF